MEQSRKAYDCGRMVQWKELYLEIKVEVKIAKKESARSIERNQMNLSKFCKQLLCVLGKNR